MKQKSKNNLEVETIGVPIIDALSTEDKKAFAKALLLCAVEYYKGQNEKDDKKNQFSDISCLCGTVQI